MSVDRTSLIRKTFLSAAIFFVCAHNAWAGKFSVGEITISKVWARALPAVSKNGAAYFTLTNHGSSADRLIAVETAMAKKTQIHTHTMTDGVAKMRQVRSIEIPGSNMLVLKPGMGLHIMMLGLEEPLVSGDTFSMMLRFEKAGDVTAVVVVKSE